MNFRKGPFPAADQIHQLNAFGAQYALVITVVGMPEAGMAGVNVM